MEVSVDPGMVFGDEESITIEDDEETVSATEAKIETARLTKEESESAENPPVENKVSFKDAQPEPNEDLNDGKYICTSCNEMFTTNTDLENHVLTHLITSTSSIQEAVVDSVITKPLKKKKLKEDKLRSRRRKVVIRINPSPSRRNGREKAKFVPKFLCAICNKSLSSKRNLHLHQETHKEANGKFRCDGEGCKKFFGKLENYVKHRALAKHLRPKKKNQNEK